jgi:hypothetical protein
VLDPERLRQTTQERLDGFVDEVAGENEGPGAQVLVEAAEEAELLVVGSRGHGGFGGLLLGSAGKERRSDEPNRVKRVRPEAAIMLA